MVLVLLLSRPSPSRVCMRSSTALSPIVLKARVRCVRCGVARERATPNNNPMDTGTDEEEEEEEEDVDDDVDVEDDGWTCSAGSPSVHSLGKEVGQVEEEEEEER